MSQQLMQQDLRVHMQVIIILEEQGNFEEASLEIQINRHK